MKISVNFLTLLVIMFAISLPSYSQYHWTVYTGDQNFVSLEDTIDKGCVLYHKLAQNNLSITGNRGVLFNNVKFFVFPSLTGSFSWSQVQVSTGKISFYPHIYTFKNGTTTLAIAIMFNVSRVDPVRGIRTRPSMSPSTISQLERERMDFSHLKFVTEGFETSLMVQKAVQETELLLNDYEVSYNYWVKSAPSGPETDGILTFFNRPMTSFRIRSYSDKGYLDTSLSGGQVTTLRDIFVKTINLYQRLTNTNYVMANTNTNTNVATNTNATTNAATNATTNAAAPAKKAPAKKAPAKKAAAAKAPAKKAPDKKVVTTNQRPKTTRVVTPK